MPKIGNVSPYNIRDALNATSTAINALKAGDAVILEPVALDSDIDTSEEAEADIFLNSIGGLWMTKKEDSLSKSMPSLMRVHESVSKVPKRSQSRQSTKLEIIPKSKGSITTSKPTVNNHNNITGERCLLLLKIY